MTLWFNGPIRLEYSEISLAELEHQVLHAKSIALPQFQRPFVWDEERIGSLLTTILLGWPCGAVLTTGKGELLEKIAVQPLAGGPDVEKEAVELLILDGQQRLTSVYQAIRDVHPDFHFYVDMKSVAKSGEVTEESVRFCKKGEFPAEDEAAEKQHILFGHLFNQARFEDWLAHLPSKERDRMSSLVEHELASVRVYKFPALKLDPQLGLRAIVRVFDKLNSTGEQLKTFDLLYALLLPEGFDLRTSAEEAAQRVAGVGNRTQTWDAIEIVKLLALQEHVREKEEGYPDDGGTVGGIKPDHLVNLVQFHPKIFKKKWKAATDDYVAALEFLRDECGGVRSNLMPKDSLILALAMALAVETSRSDWHDDLKRWIWAASLSQTYAAGANTEAVKDALELRAWAIDKDKVPRTVKEFGENPERIVATINGSGRGNQGFITALMAMLVAEGAKDWLTPKKPNSPQELMAAEKAIDSHHVFPASFMDERNMASDQVANRTPLMAATNRAIGKDAPSTVVGMERFDPHALTTHLIDEELFKEDDFDAFLADRRIKLAKLIASTTGVPSIAKLAASA